MERALIYSVRRRDGYPDRRGQECRETRRALREEPFAEAGPSLVTGQSLSRFANEARHAKGSRYDTESRVRKRRNRQPWYPLQAGRNRHRESVVGAQMADHTVCRRVTRPRLRRARGGGGSEHGRG